MKRGKIGLRPLGSIAGGVVIALAGGFGVAVGVYSLPDPQNAGVGGDAYARASQRAVAVYKDQFDGGARELRIEVGRGVSAGGNAGVSTSSGGYGAGEDHNAYFSATRQTCYYDQGWCGDWQEWSAAVPLDSFRFDPAMESAGFSGRVGGCDWEITWTGTGVVAPFHGHFSESRFGPWGGGASVDGFAEVSHVAPARIDSCVGSFADVPGFLSQGLTRTRDDVGSGTG